jgi:Mg-chelatase subunit ChlD
MSNEIQKLSGGLQQPSTVVQKGKFGSGMMSVFKASLGQLELPRMFNQLVLFILDGSGSMTFNGISGKSKGYEVHLSVVTVLERLLQSKNKASFDVGLIAFGEDAVEMFPVKPATKYNLQTDCFNPCEFIQNYRQTNVLAALKKAETIAEDYLLKHKESNVGVLILVLGDGAIHDFQESYKIKEEMNQLEKVSFSSVLLETPEWGEKYSTSVIEEMREDFRKLASDGASYLSTCDPEHIRKHMIQSITKVSKL